ncbi:MAG: aspartate--tRNA ligase [Candidatus Babeliales bacterium]|jgi:aspartyl-tRNA synthetase
MQFLKRSIVCGHIREEHVGKEVVLNGWVHRHRDLGGLVFVDLRDQSGLMQLFFDPSSMDAAMATQVRVLRAEWVIAVAGTVKHRATGAINDKLPTGRYEVLVTRLQVLNKAQPLPFQLEGEDTASDEMRLRYRYIDLRRAAMQHMLKMRHDIMLTARQYFDQQRFCEIETPTLTKCTPGGARNFVVPCRLQPGTFYALTESPQLYKQLLMAGGVEKYFQIVRCFRDEALRANRQPEFTQLDIEMSFIDETDIQKVCEGLVQILWKKFLNVELTLPLKRYTYDEVFARFGSDKPDMRFKLEVNDISALFKGTGLKFIASTLEQGGRVGCLQVSDKRFSRAELDRWTDYVTKELGAKGLVWIRWREDGSIDSPLAKHLPADFFEAASHALAGLRKTDTLFVVAGPYEEAWTTLGQLRLTLGKELGLIDVQQHALFWVTDFPLFEFDKEKSCWQARHHQFTAPQDGWETLDIKDIKARAYDLVCNGEELGGGSIRIHSSEVQNKIFDLLGVDKQLATEKFGFLFEAQNLGYPPEGGLAFGFDRLVMMLCGTDAIRNVIAFPKTQNGSCLMMQAPSEVDEALLKDVHLKSTYVKKD